MSQISGTEPLPVDALDTRKIGEILISLGAAAELAGHAEPASTVRDYVHPEYLESPGPELEFVRDMFTCTTAEITERWYGGQLAAAVRTAAAIASFLPAPRG